MAHKHGTPKKPYMDPLPGKKPKGAGPLSAGKRKKHKMGSGTKDKSGAYGGQLKGHEGNPGKKSGYSGY